MKIPLTSQYPILYWPRVWQRRLATYLKWYFLGINFAKLRLTNKLGFRYFCHQSKLIKALGNSSMEWQINKVTNLRIAISKIDGIVIEPKKYFSFWKLVGNPTKTKGYLEGMELSRGEARAGIGGGLCQLTNLIHWLALHTPLKVIQRSAHSFDPFPDEGRVLPYGTGAAVFYNYIDLCLFNPTDDIFQINLWLTDKLLQGEIRIDTKPLYKYHIYEKNHKFLKIKDKFYRTNEIWQIKHTRDKEQKIIEDRRMYKNFVVVKYTPSNFYEE